MNSHSRSGRGQMGFNIVELLVAIAIGGILLTGAISLFINNRTTSQLTQDLARIQENGRFAMDMILSDLRRAGYFGCANDMSRIVVNSNMGALSGELWDPIAPIEGIDNYANGDPIWLPSEYDDSALNEVTVRAATDAITIRYLGTRKPDHDLIAQSGSAVTVTSTTNMTAGLVLGIADCGAIDIIRLCPTSSCGASGINTAGADPVLTVDGTLSRAYAPENSPVVAPLVAVRYFIAENTFTSSLDAANNQQSYSLFRTSYTLANDGTLSEQNRELFEGVSNLQLLYGLDTDGDDVADDFVTAGSANLDTDADDWANIVAVKVGLLVESPIGYGAVVNQQLGNLLDEPLDDVDDKKRRRMYSTTVQIRNL